MKDTTFYNAESGIYSKKRYPEVARTFTQFFFKERLRKTIVLLKEFLPAGEVSMLEIGCADGVVARALWQAFPNKFKKFDAVDIATHMIEAAQKQTIGTSIRFAVREGSVFPDTYDAIIEIGVLNYTGLQSELYAVAGALSSRGLYLCSISGTSSMQSALKGADDFMHHHTYAEYEQEFAKYFTTARIVPVGFFVPLLWKMPALARVLQPMIEQIVLSFAPKRAHEKIYVFIPKQ